MSEIDRATLSGAGTVLFPFLRALAHEMSGPLISVLGYAQLNLSSPPTPDGLVEDLQEIESAAQRLREHVATLGRLSRYLEEERESSARELVRDLRLLATPAFRHQGCEILWREVDLGELTLQGNPWLLRVVVLALLGASFRPGELEVEIRGEGGGLAIQFPPAPAVPLEPPHPCELGSRRIGEQLLDHLGASLTESGARQRLFIAGAAS